MNYVSAKSTLDSILSKNVIKNSNVQLDFYLLQNSGLYKQKNYTKMYDCINDAMEVCNKNNLKHKLSFFYVELAILYAQVGERNLSLSNLNMAETISLTFKDSLAYYKIKMARTAIFPQGNVIQEYENIVKFYTKFGDDYINAIITCNFNIGLHFIET